MTGIVIFKDSDGSSAEISYASSLEEELRALEEAGSADEGVQVVAFIPCSADDEDAAIRAFSALLMLADATADSRDNIPLANLIDQVYQAGLNAPR